MAFSTASCHQLIWSPTPWGVPKTPSAGWWLSLPHLVSNSSDLQLTEFLFSPSYIIVQSPTQSLEWPVCRHQAEITVMQFTVHSLPVHQSMSVPWDFYLVPFFQPRPPTWFLLITAIGISHFLPVHNFGMACLAGSKVNMQHRVRWSVWISKSKKILWVSLYEIFYTSWFFRWKIDTKNRINRKRKYIFKEICSCNILLTNKRIHSHMSGQYTIDNRNDSSSEISRCLLFFCNCICAILFRIIFIYKHSKNST